MGLPETTQVGKDDCETVQPLEPPRLMKISRVKGKGRMCPICRNVPLDHCWGDVEAPEDGR